MERSLEVRVGEAVAVRYELAGLGSRFLAVVIDMTIQVSVVIAFVLILALMQIPVARIVAGIPGARTLNAVGLAALIFATFVLFFGYFIMFELAWQGRTPGKRAVGIRVVRDEGFPIDVGAAVIRNCVRIFEFGLGFYAFSAAVTLLSAQNKRLGDYAGGTIVVRDGELAAPALVDLVTDVPLRDDGLDAADHALIERFFARRASLAPEARSEIAARLADRVRPKLRASFAHLGDEALLEHLAWLYPASSIPSPVASRPGRPTVQ